MALHIEAFRSGTLVGTYEAKLGHPSYDYSLSDLSSSFISLEGVSKNNLTQDFADINRLSLVATGGNNAQLSRTDGHLAIDNIVVCSNGMHGVMETYKKYEQDGRVEQDFVGVEWASTFGRR